MMKQIAALGLGIALSCAALPAAAQAQRAPQYLPHTELILQGGAGIFPYLGFSGLATLRSGALALGAFGSSGVTTYSHSGAQEVGGGIGYAFARPGVRLVFMPVVGVIDVQGVAVVGECNGDTFNYSCTRDNPGITATEPFVGARANLMGTRGHLVTGAALGLDYTFHSATQDYQSCPVSFFESQGPCKTGTAAMTRVLLTLELTFGGLVF